MVLATKGHLKDLPPKEYGIDFKNNFSPTYVWLKGKKTLFSQIKKTAKLATHIFIASDPDREGEMIAEHISEELGKLKAQKYRVRMPEISRSALKSALNSPSQIDDLLVDSQICRRLIDRIFGFEISPVLWKDLNITGLSAGRVQSAVLKWICEREIEIRNFISEKYVSLEAIIEYNQLEIPLSYISKDEDKKLDLESALKILAKYGMKQPGRIPGITLFDLIKVEEKEYKYFPPPPFSTANLQETAAKVLGFSSTQTMRIAQSLYEGKRLNGEMIGLITYMRTDSNQVSAARIDNAIKYLSQNRSDLKIAKQRNSKTKLHAQGSHEAIAPTDPSLIPENIRAALSKDEFSLYQLIWERMMTSLLEPETGIEKVYIFESNGESWKSKQKSGKTLGYKSFSGKFSLPKDEFTALKIGSKVNCNHIHLEEKKTSPKERYTEGQIIAKMETTGIGRPSTYSQTLETLKKRKYILEIKKKLGASALGEMVNDYLLIHFESLIGEQFTKDMETALDDLAMGSGNKLNLLSQFYEKVKKLKSDSKISFIKNTSVNSSHKKEIRSQKKLKVSESKSVICPICKEGKVKSKFSKNGKTIYYCSRYPQCDFVSYELLQTE